MHAVLRAACLAFAFTCASAQAGAPESVRLPPSADGVAVEAFWHAAAGASFHPTVIALHGCGGLYSSRKKGVWVSRHAAMDTILHEAGYNVLWIDSFGARGATSICSIKLAERSLTEFTRRGDVLAGLAWLGARGDIDTKRIALLGWSHGGSTVLASVDGLDSVPKPAGAVAFYPGCRTFIKKGMRFANTVPLAIHIGAADDWTPPEHCVALERAAQGRGAGIELALYPDSYHDFDAPDQPIRTRSDVPNGKNPQGVTTGSNLEQRARAYAATLAFLARVFATSP